MRHVLAPPLAVLLAALIAAGAGCAFRKHENLPRPLKAREILQLVSRSDELPLPVATGATVLDVGQFAEAPRVGAPPQDAPLCPGRRYELLSHSRLVPAELMRGFGFTFVLQGEPQAGGGTMGSRGVPLVLEVEHPPVHNPVTGEVVTREYLHIMGCIGHESDAVFQFSSDWELVSGPWTLRLLSDGRELAAKRFDIAGGHAPASMTAQAGRSETAAEPPDLRVRLQRGFPEVARQAEPPAPLPQGPRASGGRLVFVLVSSNLYKSNAVADMQRMRSLGYPAELGIYYDRAKGQTWHTVRLGRYATVREAESAALDFTRREGRQAYVVVRSRDSVADPGSMEVQAPEPEAAAPLSGGFAVQVGAYLEPGNASHDAAGLQARGWQARVLERVDARGRRWHIVVLGASASRAEAGRTAARFRQQEGRKALLVETP